MAGFVGGNDVNGAKRIPLRAAVAALLNSTLIDYPFTTSEVLTMTSTALGQDRNSMLAFAAELDALNNLGCPSN